MTNQAGFDSLTQLIDSRALVNLINELDTSRRNARSNPTGHQVIEGELHPALPRNFLHILHNVKKSTEVGTPDREICPDR
jgi:hypothetical protein